MGEFRDGVSPEQDAMISRQNSGSSEPGKIQTDVENIFADGMKDNLPVFDVEADEFNNNMRADRKRMKYNSNPALHQYMQQTRYNRPFWVRTKDQGYMRKIK